MIRIVAADGPSSIEFKDNANRAANQTARAGNVIHAANLCTEILEVTSEAEPAVCHVGAINLARHVNGQDFDFEHFAQTVRSSIRQLDTAIDRNHYALATARASSERWRPIGLGIMGLQDVFFRLHLPFDSFDARQLSTRIAEALYFHALDTSADLAAGRGPHPAFADTRVAQGELQFDTWGITPSEEFDWAALRAKIARQGVRNSLLVAIGPTASLSSIASCFECIEPQISNFFQRKTAASAVTHVNPYLVEELKQLGLWNESMRTAIRLAGGSIQGIYQLPEELRTVFRTAWEVSTLAMIDLAADRGAFVDQSQSLNLFLSTPSVAQLSQLYLYAWKCRLKTTHSLRARRSVAAERDDD
jgi:ribonucleoside-diphosphate reductase alpha chain